MTNQVDTLGVPLKVGDKALHVSVGSSSLYYQKVFIVGFTPHKICYKVYLKESQRKNAEDRLKDIRNGVNAYITPEKYKATYLSKHSKTVPHRLIKLDWEGEPGWTLEKQIEWAKNL